MIRLRQLLQVAKYRFAANRSDSPSSQSICPCCNRHVAGWVDFSPIYKKVICPFCFSHRRHRHLSLYLRQTYWGEMRLGRVLHVAPERPIQKLIANRCDEYLTLDLKGCDVNASLTELPFAGGSFHIVFCSHVLEHIDDDRKAMREMYRALRPGGVALLSVPLEKKFTTTFEDPRIQTPEARRFAFGQVDHVRLYGLDFTTRLEEAGFRVERHHLPAEYYRRCNLDIHEDLFIATKPAATNSSLKKVESDFLTP